MANNPNNSDNNPQSGNGSGNPPGPKPRATIMMKKNNPAGGSSPVIIPPSSNAPGSSARIVPAQSARMSPAASARRPAVDREALGLSSARPSEKISGLDEAAKRAEAQAAREEAKRKSGGKMSANLALHVDDTGARWKRNVMAGIIGIVVVSAMVFGFLYWKANVQRVSDRAAAEETRGTLNSLAKQTELMKTFEDSDTVTVQSVKDRIKASLNESLQEVNEQLKRDHDHKRNPDLRLIERRTFLEKLAAFKDGWGKPVELKIDGDEVEYSSKGKFDGNPVEPVRVKVKSGGSPAEKPVEKADPKK